MNQYNTRKSHNELIGVAESMCIEWHSGQTRKYTGEPYYNHPIEVATTLAKAGEGDAVIIAGLLHDVIEDCDVTYGAIKAMFGMKIADIVMMVTNANKASDGNRATRKAIDRDHIAMLIVTGKHHNLQ